jgi:hypothetical protein
METQTKVQVKEKMNSLQEHAEKIKNDGNHDLSNFEIGDEWRQGDVRVIRISKKNFNHLFLKRIENFNGQVAPGDTLGSRHILDDISSVEAFSIKNGSDIDGPVCILHKPNNLRHPEHGDLMNIPAGFYCFPGQRVYDIEEIRRVQD